MPKSLMPHRFTRPLSIALGALATTALSGCYYGDVYGSSYASGGDCAARYGNTYYDSDGYAYDDGYGYDCYDASDYGGGFAQIGFGGGWYDDYYYPGYGTWMFDNARNRYPLRGQYLNYWGGRRAWWKHHGGRGDGQPGRPGGWNRGDGDGRPGDGRPGPPGGWNRGDRDNDGPRGTRPGRGDGTPPAAGIPGRPDGGVGRPDRPGGWNRGDRDNDGPRGSRPGRRPGDGATGAPPTAVNPGRPSWGGSAGRPRPEPSMMPDRAPRPDRPARVDRQPSSAQPAAPPRSAPEPRPAAAEGHTRMNNERPD
ncbi:hypothetical protein [Sphingopyxis sp.]|uniref:hypothetical protein n=1 Tax=Sphingopyxis sp. TaxID=1908224 RepID=UPI003D0BC80D